MNMDVWGSFRPLNAQCYDIQLTRAAAFTKLVSMRQKLHKMLIFWEDFAEESGPMIQNLIA